MRPFSSRHFLAIFFTSFILSLLLDYGAGPPPSVDSPLSLSLWISILLQFVLWLLGMHAWGKIFLGAVGLEKPSGVIALAAGSLLYATILFFLGTAGLLRSEMKISLFFFQAAGLALASKPSFRFGLESTLAAFPLALLFSLYALDSLVMHPYWDPLHHHLVGPRLFWEKGQIFFPEHFAASYQEGGFELLFLWPHFLFAKAGGLGLIPVQIFSQLTHSVLGFGGSLLLAFSLAARWLPNIAWRMLAVSLFAIPASLSFAIPTAKNDWGIVFWILAGFLLLAESPKTKADKHFFIAGFFWGFSFLAKLSSGFAIAGLSAIFLFRWPSRNEALSFTAAFVMGMLPRLEKLERCWQSVFSIVRGMVSWI
jgi:hypothetical protein